MNNFILFSQQSYLAEKFRHNEDHIQQMSRMALLKLQSLQMVRQSKYLPEERKFEMEDFVQQTLLNLVPNNHVLSEEGFYFAENNN
jgi:hypothetical protein